MKKLSQYSLFLAAMALTYSLFYPNHYDVSPFKERPNTQFWQLKTGSKIGYTLIKSESNQKRNPIIYLHGGPGGMIKESTLEILKPLSKTHDLYFYDQVGSGHSSRLENIGEYSVMRHKKDLEEIITQIGAEKIILMGHSWGAMLAMTYLADNQLTVEKVILTGPGPILPIRSELSHQKAPDSLHLIKPKFSNREANEKVYNRRSKLVHYWANVFEQKLASDQEMDNFFTRLNTELNKSTVCDGSKMKAFEGGSGYYAHIMTLKSFGAVEDKRD
ncbi:MAG: alpha/beta fold hydrolase, partial [Chitinophagales bacterium]